MKPSNFFSNLFKRDHQRYDGVAPINIYLLRLLFLLMFIFVNLDTWPSIFTQQSWDPVKAAAVCMWASYAALSFIGILRPLLLLPIVIFEIIYKSVWLIIVAYPLWINNQLAGSPAEQMTQAFLWLPLPILAMPWRYFFRKYVLLKKQ
ncbi:MAG TPA: hypothetical protein VD993_02005 [Chitinophagaceae bacterium]|nr:hypothetical protein [Chitinophagaceae bacterium]